MLSDYYMADQSNFDNPADDPAQRLVRSIDQFVDEFIHRTPSEHATEVLYDSTPLSGRKIGQAPERFIEEYLIRDVANALGYEYRPQPKGFDGLEGRIPDFTIANTSITVIGELKRPNFIEKARSESVEYLDMATARPLVGLATDGWTWVYYEADHGEEPTYSSHVPLRPVIRDLARERSSERASRQSRRELRESCSEFADSFGIEAIQELSS